MGMQEILDIISKIHEHLMIRDASVDKEKRTFLDTIKLSEEVWELNEQILWHYGYGRKEKLEKCSSENLEQEIADVIFSAMMIAKSLDIDVEKAMSNKLQKIKHRFEIE